ncbi:MAG: ATP-binding protein [Syntrophaceae bacterium]
MIIAVASGKGGTGKTTLSLGLASVMPGEVQILDCDVEAPNCHLFLEPRIEDSEEVGIPVPVVDEGLCDGCGECQRACQFRAIAVIGEKPMVFPELCHGCGACLYICPRHAISERARPIGVVESGVKGDIRLVQGRLNIGEPMAPPVIRAVKHHAADAAHTIIDCPPGTSCPMVTAVRGSDCAVLVTEPTPFGLNDLILAVATVRALAIPFGVAINRVGIGDARVADFCRAEDIAILAEIPDDRRVAEVIARGGLPWESVPGMRGHIEKLYQGVLYTLKNQRRKYADL